MSSLVAYASDSDASDTEENDVASATEPSVPKATESSAPRQIRKITVPSLKQFKDIDDNDKPGRKRPKPGTTKCRLTALLPVARRKPGEKKERPPSPEFQSFLKTPSESKPRGIVPPKVETTIIRSAPRKPEPVEPTPADESDTDDDEPSSFFSFGENPPAPLPMPVIPPLDRDDDESPEPGTSTQGEEREVIQPHMPMPAGPSLPSVDDDGDYNYPTYNEFGEMEDLIHDKKFKSKLVSSWNAEDDPGFVEIKADKQIDKSQFLKNLTQEPKYSTSFMKRRQAMPHGEQKRRHQITYLAWRAKDQETELKDMWSQNRFDRKQFAQRYGF